LTGSPDPPRKGRAAISATSAIGAAWPATPKIMRQLTFTNPYRFLGTKAAGF
jgi:hypothetical protein